MDNEVTNSATARGVGPVMATLIILARAGGLVLLAVGIVTMTRVAFEAWSLYKEPARIVRFAEAVERGSNIDKVLLPSNRGQGTGSSTVTEQRYAASGDDLRPSYFLAWIVAIPLLLAIGVLALWATKAGAELTVYGWPHTRPRR